MATTFLEMQDRVLKTIALKGDSDTRTEVENYLNEAAREIWTAYPWRERVATAFITTTEPYTTGTVTFTNGSTTVTGTGTTWTDAMAGRRMALAHGYPWYTIDSRTSGTELELDRAYVEDTATGSTYTIYQDAYELADCDALLPERVLIFKDGAHIPLRRMNTPDFYASGGIPSGSGIPSCFRMTEDASDGSPQMQLYPVPDDAYAIQYAYLKSYTDMSGDTDECVVPENRRGLIVTGALRDAYRLNGEYNKAVHEEQRFIARLSDFISAHRRESPTVSILRPFDQSLGGVYLMGLFYADI